MIRVWRLVHKAFVALDGEGIGCSGGGWNPAGRPVVYTSVHLSLALLETLMRVRTRARLRDYVCLEIEVSDEGAASLERVERLLKNERESQAIGDSWLRRRHSLLMSVPSAIVPGERNVLINPWHKLAYAARVVSREKFAVDRRLLVPDGKR